ncbi:MAG: hypothetical protein GX384_01700 [Clostridiaceae bacterium]|jgi:hypothetical protein|nr:hypothetical protein [Bacillota bacterium]NLI38046.1 hypothetical protein [Clostridiaceae bacterium]
MERTVRKPKINALFLVLAFLLVIALAAGAYFLFGSGRREEPNRGTYVFARYPEVKGL